MRSKLYFVSGDDDINIDDEADSKDMGTDGDMFSSHTMTSCAKFSRMCEGTGLSARVANHVSTLLLSMVGVFDLTSTRRTTHLSSYL